MGRSRHVVMFGSVSTFRVRDEEAIAINVMGGLQDALVSVGVESAEDYTRTQDTFSL